MFPVSQGNVETYAVRCMGTYNIFLIAYFLRTFLPEVIKLKSANA